eukprot:15792-Heterococcus_DN1.PRE.9
MRWLDTRSNIARTLACCTLACCSFAHLSCPYTCTLLTSSSATHSKRCVRSLLLAIIPLQCAILDTNAAKSLAVGDKVLARHPTSLWRLYPGTVVSPYDAKTWTVGVEFDVTAGLNAADVKDTTFTVESYDIVAEANREEAEQRQEQQG